MQTFEPKAILRPNAREFDVGYFENQATGRSLS
jgi:hypothetical protein